MEDTVQGVKNLEDGRLRAAVTHGAFRPKVSWDRYWAEYAQFIGSAAYVDPTFFPACHATALSSGA